MEKKKMKEKEKTRREVDKTIRRKGRQQTDRNRKGEQRKGVEERKRWSQGRGGGEGEGRPAVIISSRTYVIYVRGRLGQ